jgi:cytosine/adenosine deaminase-related metal-dependent hydrolase
VAAGLGRRAARGRNLTAVQVLSADWVIPVEGSPIQDGAVAIDDGRIAALGPRSELGPSEHFGDAVILPGFVNGHSHLEYAVYAGFGDGLSFAPWIAIHIERKARIRLAEMEAIARSGAFECLRSGITTVGDCSFSGAAVTACAEIGLRAVVFLEVFGSDRSVLDGRFGEQRERVAQDVSDRVRLGISPHAPYTCTPELYAACLELDLPLATHFNESSDELAWLVSGDGPWEALAAQLAPPLGESGIRALARGGLLSPRFLAAHCVKIDDEEIGLLADNDVAVIHCPRSNAVLGCGIAPLAKLRAAGLRVGLGTDSPASAPSFDMFDEMRVALYAARAHEERPDAVSAADVLELATLGSARALGLDEEIGSLTPGKHADLTVLSLAASPFLPWEDPVTATVLGGSPERVVATLVSGEPRYEKGGKTWPELTDDAHNARSRLLSHVGATP